MVSLMVFHGRIFPAFWDSAVARARPLVSSFCQAPGKFSGKISAAEMIAGGAESFAVGVNTPAGIDSPRRLAGPDVSQIEPLSTAVEIAFSATCLLALGIWTDSL